MLKLPCGADKTEDVIHESPVKSTSHTSEGVASVFQSFCWKKATSISKSSDLHVIEVVIFQTND